MRFLLLVQAACIVVGAQVPVHDSRITNIRHTDTHYSFDEYTADEWKARATFLRKQILFSAGLLPLPDKTPLHAQISEPIVHDDYTVENVLLETYPGYYLGGNLYSPVGKQGPFPAVVSPHGHWRYGRFENSELNSTPARAISFARQGYVVFNYDMVGWNDTSQLPHGFAGKREELWLIGTLGTQLWNSIRVVDFLKSLPAVDDENIAVTGASGGGTQAFLLAAVDDRIRYSAPVNMVSFVMQGGSRCENAPLLRVDTHNVEFAAVFAPKPQMLIAATGDWTRNMPREEYPAIQSIYRLLDAESNLDTQQFDSPHNYHQESREAVYRFFGKHVLGDFDASHFRERSVRVDDVASLLSLFGRGWPANAVDLERFIAQRIAAAESDIHELFPKSGETLKVAKEAFRERLQLALLPENPSLDELVSDISNEEVVISRKNIGDRVTGKMWNVSASGITTLVVHPEGSGAAEASELVKNLVADGGKVLAIDAFQSGRAKSNRDIAGAGRNAERYYRVFNRTDDANRVQDVMTAITFLRKGAGADKMNVVGQGRAGLWVAVAAALSDENLNVVVDFNRFNASSDQAYLDEYFIPGFRRAGDFRAIAVLLSGQRLMVHNTASGFPEDWFEAAFRAAGNKGGLETRLKTVSAGEIRSWLGD